MLVYYELRKSYRIIVIIDHQVVTFKIIVLKSRTIFRISNLSIVCNITGLLYPFGDELDFRSPVSLDGGTGPIPLEFGPLPYYGSSFFEIYVSDDCKVD